MQNTHQFIELTLQPTYSKSKMSDSKPFIDKREEYKSWKWDMNNKFMWESERFNTDGHQIAYVINCLENKSLFMVKATVFVYLELHLGVTLADLWVFLDSQYVDDKLKVKAFNKL